MEFKGYTWEVLDDRIVFTRNPETEVEKSYKLVNNTVVIMFDQILRVFAGRKLGQDAIAFNVISVKSASKPPRYEPFQYTFIPSGEPDTEALDTIVKFVNLTVFGHPAPSPKRFKIIINPKSGKGKAKSIYKKDVLPILQAAGCNVVEQIPENRTDLSHVVTTTAAREAITIAQNLILDHYDAILCIGGDGIVHEVINGLANRPDGMNALNSMCIAVIPAGSGNALSVSLFGNIDSTYAAWQAVKFKRIVVDLMSVEPVDKTAEPVWLFVSIAFGWIAHADIHTENWRFIGDARFTAGVGIQMLLKKGYTCSVATYGHLVEPDATKPELKQREETKEHVVEHYNTEYQNPPESSQMDNTQSNLKELVGTKRPMDKWEHKTYDRLFSFYAGKLPWTSRTAQAFPAALSNDGYIDLCILDGNVGWSQMLKIFNGFDNGLHFNHPQITYMKVKSFKLLPGVKHQGVDNETLHNDAPSEQQAENKQTEDQPDPSAEPTTLEPIPAPIRPAKRSDVDSRKFKDKFVLSVDGERYNPGHGIICEVHQGLANFIADSKLQKYQPSVLLKPQNTTTATRDENEEDENAELQRRMSAWMNTMSAQLKKFEGSGGNGNGAGAEDGDFRGNEAQTGIGFEADDERPAGDSRNCNGPRERPPVVLGNTLKFCTIRELSAFAKFGPGYKSVVQHVVRNMIRQNLNNNENKFIVQQSSVFPELNDELEMKTNLLKEFTSENATIHVTASGPYHTGLDITQLNVLELIIVLPCGVLKYHWDPALPARLGPLDSEFDMALDSVGEDTWAEVLPLRVIAHTHWSKLNAFAFNLHTLEKAWIVGLL